MQRGIWATRLLHTCSVGWGPHVTAFALHATTANIFRLSGSRSTADRDLNRDLFDRIDFSYSLACATTSDLGNKGASRCLLAVYCRVYKPGSNFLADVHAVPKATTGYRDKMQGGDSKSDYRHI